MSSFCYFQLNMGFQCFANYQIFFFTYQTATFFEKNKTRSCKKKKKTKAINSKTDCEELPKNPPGATQAVLNSKVILK